MSETVLIIGGAGFIGSKLSQVLRNEGHKVVVLDNFQQYSNPLEINYASVLAYRKQLLEGCEIVRGDATVSFDLINVIENFKPDRVIHLGAVTRADINDANITNSVMFTIMPIIHLMQILQRHPIKRFLYVSSSYVYGNFQYSPCDENHPLNPTSTYGSTKLSAEIYTKALGQRFNVPYTIVRLIAVYGPGDVNGKLSMQNIKSALDSGEIPVMGSLDELADYSYIDDTVSGLMKALFSGQTDGKTLNISSGQGVEMSELIKIFDELGYAVKPKMMPVTKSRPKRGYLSIKFAQELIDYQPTTPLNKGLKKCIEFIKNNKVFIGE
ncbi:NAD-dependent epimerase/dehydratase family protein [Thermoactinomyces mirandus]|uniref:NAD(P)-dependent oxidoreductase n=1 Tax=Thermoactinomyces mirandus TaxID=2756294 RepID=A0A7W2ATL6_9BACL|nr:NAD(P)-dependent oxidoreductase [Thermoactinomyces mirandus]MBA4603651.1 NAD(P)-dependent oxidoreductase [Thermoactinomyces mirandus]